MTSLHSQSKMSWYFLGSVVCAISLSSNAAFLFSSHWSAFSVTAVVTAVSLAPSHPRHHPVPSLHPLSRVCTAYHCSSSFSWALGPSLPTISHIHRDVVKLLVPWSIVGGSVPVPIALQRPRQATTMINVSTFIATGRRGWIIRVVPIEQPIGGIRVVKAGICAVGWRCVADAFRCSTKPVVQRVREGYHVVRR